MRKGELLARSSQKSLAAEAGFTEPFGNRTSYALLARRPGIIRSWGVVFFTAPPPLTAFTGFTARGPVYRVYRVYRLYSWYLRLFGSLKDQGRSAEGDSER